MIKSYQIDRFNGNNCKEYHIILIYYDLFTLNGKDIISYQYTMFNGYI